MNSQSPNAASVLTELTRYMDTRRLRKTPERLAVAQKAVTMGPHFSADTLHAAMEADGYHVSRATVYNTILLLEEAGIVRRRSFNIRPACYEFASPPSAGLAGHFHLVCSSCGKVREVRDPDIESLLAHRRFGTFQPRYADVSIYGLCSRCARSRRRTATKRKQ
ncbi:MAG: transcriptional repressor [Muribaculaceae bacterium]|nr:transcriptional repressor [Muribaculaceae bacterium]